MRLDYLTIRYNPSPLEPEAVNDLVADFNDAQARLALGFIRCTLTQQNLGQLTWRHGALHLSLTGNFFESRPASAVDGFHRYISDHLAPDTHASLVRADWCVDLPLDFQHIYGNRLLGEGPLDDKGRAPHHAAYEQLRDHVQRIIMNWRTHQKRNCQHRYFSHNEGFEGVGWAIGKATRDREKMRTKEIYIRCYWRPDERPNTIRLELESKKHRLPSSTADANLHLDLPAQLTMSIDRARACFQHLDAKHLAHEQPNLVRLRRTQKGAA